MADVGEPEPILVPSEILVETVGLIEHRAGRGAARDALATILSLRHVAVAEPVPTSGVAALYHEQYRRLSLADCALVQTCRALGLPALTYDEAILKALRARP